MKTKEIICGDMVKFKLGKKGKREEIVAQVIGINRGNKETELQVFFNNCILWIKKVDILEIV